MSYLNDYEMATFSIKTNNNSMLPIDYGQKISHTIKCDIGLLSYNKSNNLKC